MEKVNLINEALKLEGLISSLTPNFTAAIHTSENTIKARLFNGRKHLAVGGLEGTAHGIEIDNGAVIPHYFFIIKMDNKFKVSIH